MDVKSKFLAEKVVPKLVYIVDHPERFSLRSQIVLLSGQEELAGVIYQSILVRGRHLHDTTTNGHV